MRCGGLACRVGAVRSCFRGSASYVACPLLSETSCSHFGQLLVGLLGSFANLILTTIYPPFPLSSSSNPSANGGMSGDLSPPRANPSRLSLYNGAFFAGEPSCEVILQLQKEGDGVYSLLASLDSGLGPFFPTIITTTYASKSLRSRNSPMLRIYNTWEHKKLTSLLAFV